MYNFPPIRNLKYKSSSCTNKQHKRQPKLSFVKNDPKEAFINFSYRHRHTIFQIDGLYKNIYIYII